MSITTQNSVIVKKVNKNTFESIMDSGRGMSGHDENRVKANFFINVSRCFSPKT